MSNFCGNCGKQVIQGAKFCAACGSELPGAKGKEDLKKENLKSGKNQSVLSKRDKILKNTKAPQKKKSYMPYYICGVLAAAIIIFFAMSSGENPVIKKQPDVTGDVNYSSDRVIQMYNLSSSVENGKIVIPLDVLMQKKFVAFNYSGANGQTVPLLAYISGKGKLVTAISMCEPCNSTSFHIKGEDLICNACGTTWKVNNLEVVEGACGKYPPDPLPSTVSGNKIMIDESLAANWARRI